MRKFLNDFISTLSFRGEERVHSILEQAKLEKSQINLIADKLSSQGLFANVQLAEEKKLGTIKSGSISNGFRDASVRMQELYGVSNDVDLILNSNIAILTSDIKSLNDELSALEKAANNYSFLLSDGGTYDYAFLEAFNDTRNRESGFNFLVPDRANLLFASDEHGRVLSDEGALSLPQGTTRTYPLTGRLLESNCGAFVTSASAIEGAISGTTNSGWRMAVASDTPINSTLPSFKKLYQGFTDYPGANALLEFVLPSPAPCDTLKIVPFSDTPFEIVQIEMFPGMNEENKIDLLEAPMVLDSTRNLFFQLQPLTKFKVYIRGYEYRRNALQPIASEEVYKKVVEETPPPTPTSNPVSPNPISPRQKRRNRSWLAHILNRISFTSKLVQKYLLRFNANVNKYQTAHPISLFAPKWGTASDDFIKTITSHRNPRYRWYNATFRSSAIALVLFTRISFEWLAAFFPFLRKKKTGVQPLPSETRPEIYPQVPVVPTETIVTNVEVSTIQQFKYEYNFGIQHISIGNGLNGFKGVYVSSILPSPSDVGEVKLKASQVDYVETPTTRDQAIVTSVEYSVSNQAKPDVEADWVPILPVGQLTVKAERFLPDNIGKGYFRFPASLEEDITLYKNGYKTNDLNIDNYLIRDVVKQTAIGIALPIGYATSQDIFVVDYIPAVDNTIVNFEKAGYSIPPLVSSFDEDGAGEGFTSTNGQLIIDTLYTPYVDYVKVDSSTYNESFGLTPYNPVSVRFNDGSVAINLTNYKGGTQAVLNPSTDYTYIQNGNSIMFNKAVDKPFRVYYQYLPNNLRFRVVLRANTKEFVSPKVDYVQVKAKTRKPDAKRI